MRGNLIIGGLTLLVLVECTGAEVAKSAERWIETISWSPRIFHFHKFLTDEECEHLKREAEPYLEGSTVVDPQTGSVTDAADGASSTGDFDVLGGSKASEVRTSFGMFLEREQDEVIAQIEEKIANWTMIPMVNGESIQVLRYYVGQHYQAHHDWFGGNVNTNNGGQRLATVLMYLSNVDAGGETSFPQADTSYIRSKGKQTIETACGKGGLAVKPMKGDAVLFWDQTPDNKEDPKSIHASCDVIQGIKWTATKWIHVKTYEVGSNSNGIHGRCYDLHGACSSWAESGECKNNPGFMLGRGGLNGNCLASCQNKVEPGKLKIACNDIQYYRPGIEKEISARS